MSRVEDVLTETLRDPRRALPPWPDPVHRVRAARRARRRRRLLAASTTALVLGALALAPALLREDERRQPVTAEPGPVAVVDAHFTPPAGLPAIASVVARGGDVFAGVTGNGATAGWIWRVEPSGAGVSGRLLARAAPLRMAAAGQQLWHIAFADVGPPLLGSVDLRSGRVSLLPVDGEPVALVGSADALYVVRRELRGGPAMVERRDPATGAVSATRSIASAGTPRLAIDGDILWVRTGEVATGGSRLTRLDAATLEPEGTVLLPGSLVEGAITAGSGRVWAVVAETSEIMTTASSVVGLDASLEVVHEVTGAPFALELEYAEDSVWIRGQRLARFDAATGRLRGAPIRLEGGPTGGLAVDGEHVWVGGDDGLTRYEIRPT